GGSATVTGRQAPVRRLSEAALDHLFHVADSPDVSCSKYEVIAKISQGVMMLVYLAQDLTLDRPIALYSRNHVDPPTPLRLTDIARILGSLEHPGIVPVHDVGVLPDGRTYYTMKFVRGQRLDEHVGPGLTLTARLGIFEKICEAVAFAHAHGV